MHENEREASRVREKLIEALAVLPDVADPMAWLNGGCCRTTAAALLLARHGVPGVMTVTMPGGVDGPAVIRTSGSLRQACVKLLNKAYPSLGAAALRDGAFRDASPDDDDLGQIYDWMDPWSITGEQARAWERARHRWNQDVIDGEVETRATELRWPRLPSINQVLPDLIDKIWSAGQDREGALADLRSALMADQLSGAQDGPVDAFVTDIASARGRPRDDSPFGTIAQRACLLGALNRSYWEERGRRMRMDALSIVASNRTYDINGNYLTDPHARRGT